MAALMPRCQPRSIFPTEIGTAMWGATAGSEAARQDGTAAEKRVGVTATCRPARRRSTDAMVLLGAGIAAESTPVVPSPSTGARSV